MHRTSLNHTPLQIIAAIAISQTVGFSFVKAAIHAARPLPQVLAVGSTSASTLDPQELQELADTMEDPRQCRRKPVPSMILPCCILTPLRITLSASVSRLVHATRARMDPSTTWGAAI